MGTSNKDRQAAFRDRMGQEGMVRKTWWFTGEQERAVKAFLAGGPLPVTAIPEQEALQVSVARAFGVSKTTLYRNVGRVKPDRSPGAK